MNILDKIRWYTGGAESQQHLREEYQRRELLLAFARECEELAAAWQAIADDIRSEVA